MQLVYFKFQPGGTRAGAGATFTPIYSRQRHMMYGTSNLAYDTRQPGLLVNSSTINARFNATYYRWTQELLGMAEVPKPLNGIFTVERDRPGGAHVTPRL